MVGHVGNVIGTDKRDLAVLSGGEDRVQLGDGVHEARLDQIL